MKQRITRKILVKWAGVRVVTEAEAIFKRGDVASAELDGDWIRGSITRGGNSLKTSLKVLRDGTAENHCPCWANREQGIICSHVIAVAVSLVKRMTDPMREQKYQEEQRRARRLASINESKYLQRAPRGGAGSTPAELRIMLPTNWTASCRTTGRVSIRCFVEIKGSHPCPIDAVPTDYLPGFDKPTENTLFVLEDIAEGPIPAVQEITTPDLLNLFDLLHGKKVYLDDGRELSVNSTPMHTVLQMDLDRENGELILIAHTELPFVRGEFPHYVVHGHTGWVYGAEHLWPLKTVLPGPYQLIYHEPVIVPRKDVLRFIHQEMPLLDKLIHVNTDISPDLFSVEPGKPSFLLAVKGSPASLGATLFATYGENHVIAAKGDSNDDFGIPDPNDLMRYTVRNPAAEERALRYLADTGFRGHVGDGLTHITGSHNVLNFLGGNMAELRRKGWKVSLEGRVEGFMEALDVATPVVNVQSSGGNQWFDIGFNFEDVDGSSLSQSDIQRALTRNESYIQKGSRTILIDSKAVDSMRDVFSDCSSTESDKAGHFRMAAIYAPFVKASLDALDGIDVEDTPQWRKSAATQNRALEITPVTAGNGLDEILRPYQKDGVNWLRFMETCGFCGLLADEMGLGKTLQALVWIQLKRHSEESRNSPALIICPTSLVENWARESEKFTPYLKVLPISGTQRHKLWEKVPESDIVITSYALMRRDLDRHLEHNYSIVVLDEAQHIKNRGTRNAVAAKQLKAQNRLVLTGTPIENSVADLWSIMDFLMPGYLGRYDTFRTNYEQPIARGETEGEQAQAKLRRKLHPFMLRRLKTDVARDLPDKIERISYCTLTPDQQLVYNELLKQSQRKIGDMVAEKGFNRSRMQILAILMKLRQVCCHLDLLKLDTGEAKEPSAKLNTFIELLNEAIDGGHRILVFSQFVSMLTILRKELEKRDYKYCYIDGSSKNRMDSVTRFNTNKDIPVFLISLKAGGTGLNLTGADMVIHFDPWWNPAVEDQATDRAHRIGQKRTVYSVKLITENSVEEKVLEMQQRKKLVIKNTIESDEKIATSLTWDDIQGLLDI